MSRFREALATFGHYTLASKSDQVIEDAWNGTNVMDDLAKAYSDNLRKGVSGVMQSGNVDDKFFERQMQIEANVARFATYKAGRMAQALERLKTDKDGNPQSREEFDRKAAALMKTANRYQVAEYNTTVARTRTAKQWAEFNEDTHKRLFPNLRWLPSRSAEPRPEHIQFYGIVLPKDHPFWGINYPGNLWECKCDVEETSDPATTDPSKLLPTPADKGLEGNPGVTNEVFTQKASYFNVPKATAQKCDAAYRRLGLNNARNTHKGKTVAKETDGNMIDIGFNRKGLEHIQHDRFPVPWLKDMLLEKIDQVLNKAIYAGSAADRHGNPMVKQYHYYKMSLFEKEWYIVVRELINGEAYVYSLVDQIRKEN